MWALLRRNLGAAGAAVNRRRTLTPAPADPPPFRVRRHLAEDEEDGLLSAEHHVEPEHEELFDVPKVAHDLFRGPVPGGGAAGQGRVAPTVNGRREVIRGALQTQKALLEGLLQVLFHCRHRAV